MVQVTAEIVIIVIGFILVLALMIEQRLKFNESVLDVQEQLDLMERGLEAVPYTNLTLPTICSVESFAVAVLIKKKNTSTPSYTQNH